MSGFDGNRGIRQLLQGSVYPTNEWYLGLGLNTGNPWGAVQNYEAPGARVHYTGGWSDDPSFTVDYDTAGVINNTQVDVGVTANCTLRYVFLYQGLTNTKWMLINQLYSQPLSINAGDYIRFPPGGLAFTIYS